MNDVINPFQITHPTAIQTSLLASALFAKFDPSGRWIAAGKQNGSVVIWDLETKNPVRVLDGHVRGITCIDWSRNGRFVLSASKDWNVVVWDLKKRVEPVQRARTVRFDSQVVSAAFHPRNSKIILALLSTGELFIMDMRKEYRGRIELDDNLLLLNNNHTHVEEKEEGEEESTLVTPLPVQRDIKRSPITVARFDISGRYVFAGTANGMVLVFNTRTKSMVGRHKIVGAGVMKSLDFTKNGRRFVTNSSDRILRQFTILNYQSDSTSTNNNNNNKVNEQELEPTHRFNDPINRTAWHVMAYSPDGDWLAGGSADPATHKIYIWDLSKDGQFSTALDGGREPLSHIHWHPGKSLIASTTTHGNILIWHCPKAERWGAFAGGFEEVDENIEYEEREDEFDIEDEETMKERKMKAEEREVDIDGMIDLGSRDEVSPAPGSGPQTGGVKRNLNTTTTKVDEKDVNPASINNNNTNNNKDVTRTNSKSTSPGPGTMKNTNHSNTTATTTKKGNGNGTATTTVTATATSSSSVDEDLLWADEDPDEDEKGWKMHISKSAAELAEEIGV
ncbi:hypothetical protein AGABI1DRAFT_122989 [Agaricus bisporus var. burnettii JB137-S8]|uniref:Uncharacterized protein n=1 Tax=Agaricus bisporus var. burnettii (strain JB137-S8 / ATCC MYA-4627 / FGSC 10392) TaxID=597362 RepID=K5XMB0_AGABU|nr:uncharacterized protein AGABI1DRAFT_122989 [Agaricus bisporus var. burnettii JB137-S8]EKM75695.1 hypothetical protein AGABI1DRAFT_122989 [Agaricus bisporus var. burnettii JB137-S8]